MIDRRMLIRADGAEDPEPVIVEQPDGKKVAYPRVSAELLNIDLLRLIVIEITKALTPAVTRNVVANMCQRLKDRCFFKKEHGGKPCNIARAAHHTNDHDFTDAPTPTPEEIRQMQEEAQR